MTSVLRQLQAEWNTLVPEAQARGIRRVRMLNEPLETIAYRRGKLEWLRAQLGRSTSMTAPLPPAEVGSGLDYFTFGVEIECMLPAGSSHAQIARAITAAGVPCYASGYDHTTQPHWRTVSDGSLGDYHRGVEVVSPVLRGEEGLRQLRIVCDALLAARARVNRRCGLHVHVGGWQDETASFAKNLVLLYRNCEAQIDSFVAPSRRGSLNSFCQPVAVSSYTRDVLSFDELVRSVGQSAGRMSARHPARYRKLNLMSYYQHGTVEFRQHQGTVEAIKAEHWVRFCLRMAAAARAHSTDAFGFAPFASFEEMMVFLGTTSEERAYFEGRRNHFNRVVSRRAA